MDPNALIREVESFADIDPEMQIATMLTFLYVARRGTCFQKDIELELGLSNAAASRNVAYWSDFKIRDVPGYGFISREEDPMDRRYKRLTLTDKGKAFYQRILERDYGKARG
jgi:DNA-binding MarR family transcriptional regulator